MRCICFDNDMVEVIGLCDDVTKFDITDPADPNRNWTELSIPEVMVVPPQKPDIEVINKVFVKLKIFSKRVVETPVPTDPTVPNEEGTFLTGRKLIIEGLLKQKIVYTADLPQQSLHSFHFDVPFSAFIVIPELLNGEDTLNIDFCVKSCIEDVFVKVFNSREVFKNVTLFLTAIPKTGCP